MNYNIQALNPARSKFNLSHEWKMTTDMGQIKPFLRLDCVPGDYFKLANEIVVRTPPLVAPIMHEVNIFTYYFFVPYRILFGEMVDDGRGESKNVWKIDNTAFETFLTGGVTGNNNSVTLPYWLPTGSNVTNDDGSTVADNGVGSLWDSFGLPVGTIPLLAYEDGTTHGAVNSFIKRAYNMIYNEYFRDENLQDVVDLDSNIVKNCCWGKDYFTTALPWQQRGTSPALPISISGSLPIAVTGGAFTGSLSGNAIVQYLTSKGPSGLPNTVAINGNVPNYSASQANWDSSNAIYGGGGAITNHKSLYVDGSQYTLNGSVGSISATADITGLSAVGVNVSDLRLAFQIQKILERSARGGYRYPEFLLSNFGVTIPDATLQRPLFLGGSKNPLIVSEVLQTSGSNISGQSTPQGNLSGHGLSVGVNKVTKVHINEYGCILGLMVIKPKANYSQGINRTLMKEDKYDFFRPQFCNLSEQEVKEAEIYAQNGASDNAEVFGFQERYNEYRHMPNISTGLFNTTYDYWHIGRQFASKPILNSSFVTCVPRKDCFAVPSEPGFLVNVGNIVKAYRPMPKFGTPGLIDHS